MKPERELDYDVEDRKYWNMEIEPFLNTPKRRKSGDWMEKGRKEEEGGRGWT